MNQHEAEFDEILIRIQPIKRRIQAGLARAVGQKGSVELKV